MKGQIVAIEMITVSIVLVVSLAVLFPAFNFNDRWDDASLKLKSRDMVVTIDRIGKTGTYAFSSELLSSFIDSVVPQRNLVAFSSVDGTIHNTVRVACNCTGEQINQTIFWMGRMKLNDRSIDVDVLPTNLDFIQPETDALFIWGDRNLDPFENSLRDYLNDGNGIVQMANIDSPGSVHRNIFRIDSCSSVLGSCSPTTNSPITLMKPPSASHLSYDAYKYFYQLPLPISAPDTVTSIEVEGGITECNPNGALINGSKMYVNSLDYNFSICGQSVYFDSDRNGVSDKIIYPEEVFSLGSSNFKMSYIDSVRISVSPEPNYNFNDFIDRSKLMYPTDLDQNRILISGGLMTGGIGPAKPIPGSIVGGGESARTIWLSDMSSDGFVSDEEKLFIASAILSSSNKRSRVPVLGANLASNVLSLGSISSHIGIGSRDMFEVYTFNLGLGFPF